jgi:hypothetical protein
MPGSASWVFINVYGAGFFIMGRAMDQNESDLLRGAIIEIELLKVQVAALQELIIALAIALTEKPGATLAETSDLMEAVRLLTRWRTNEDVAGGMAYVIDTLKALSHSSPLLSLASYALLVQQAGDSRLSALRTWLSQATPDELQQDLLQAFRRLLDEFPDSE